MSAPALAPIAVASEATLQELRRELASRRPERRRRHLVRLIDLAITQCEEVNLGASPPAKGMGPPAGLPAPALAVAMVHWLQADADQPARRPSTNQEALDELFRLQGAYLVTLAGAPLDVAGDGEDG
jgi:hypothetical protein